MNFNKLQKNKGEVLTPVLKAYVQEVAKNIADGTESRKKGTLDDARMTIDCFTDRIDEFNHGDPTDVPLFHPSAIGVCLRNLAYATFKAPRNSVPSGADLLKSHLTFEIGTYGHVLFQNLCKRAGVLRGREIAIVDEKRKIIGHCDGKVEIKKVDYALEIKTIGSYGFTQIEKTNVPQDSHVKQVHLYMKSLGLKHAIILYIFKDKSLTKEFVIDFDEAIYKEAFKKINYYFECCEKRVLPEREGDSPLEFPCRFCDFTKVCFDNRTSDKFMETLKNETTKKPKTKSGKKFIKRNRNKS